MLDKISESIFFLLTFSEFINILWAGWEASVGWMWRVSRQLTITGVNGEQQRPQYRSLWESCNKGMRCKHKLHPGDLVGPMCKIGSKPREGSHRNAHLSQSNLWLSSSYHISRITDLQYDYTHLFP